MNNNEENINTVDDNIIIGNENPIKKEKKSYYLSPAENKVLHHKEDIKPTKINPLPTNIEVMNLVSNIMKPQNIPTQHDVKEKGDIVDNIPQTMALVSTSDVEQREIVDEDETFVLPAGHGISFAFKLNNLKSFKNNWDLLVNK